MGNETQNQHIMTTKKEKRLIVVLGMHRSGTSAVTRSLQVMNVALGDNLMPALKDVNDAGFWEDLDIYTLNDELLNSIGSSWHHLSPIQHVDVDTLRTNDGFAKASTLLQQKLGKNEVFGFKDPRTAKLLPFWKEVFNECRVDVSYVLVVRHPLSVIKSLRKRDDFDAEKSYFLWLNHIVTSLSGSIGSKRVLVDYDKLMSFPKHELYRMANRLNLKIDPAELQRYESEFLNEALRHSLHEINDLRADDACPPLVREIYAALLDVASDKTDIDDPALQHLTGCWADEFDRLRPILRLSDKLSTECTAANKTVAELHEQTATANRTVKELNEQVGDLKQAIIESGTELSVVRRELIEVQNNLSRVFASRSWMLTRPLRELSAKIQISQFSQNKLTRILRIVATSIRQRGTKATLSAIATRLKTRASPIGARSETPSITSSAQHPTGSLHGQPGDRAKKNITLISMIRNERSIVEPFCAHALSLFDRIILVDHLSSDGTREYIKSLSERHSSIECLYFEELGYYQSEIMTWVVRNVVGNTMPGWVFFLDADEFLPFGSKEEFESRLSEFQSFPLISMPWLNLIPSDMESNRVFDELFLMPSRPSFHHKIAFQPSLIPLENYVVAQGNHALLIGDEFPQSIPAENAFPIYHLPIRTKQQLRQKISQGVESYRRMGKNRGKNFGFHWDEISRIIQTDGLTNEMMAGIAARYGDSLSPPFERNLEELRKEGYSQMRMNVSSAPLDISIDEIQVPTTKKSKTAYEAPTINPIKGSPKIYLDAETNSLKFIN